MKRATLSKNVKIYDFEKDEYFYEKVFGEWFLKWLYQSESGSLLSFLFTRLPFSKVYGALKNSPLSKKDIEPFIRDFEIATEDFKEIDYRNFNDFFIRQFRDEARSFCTDPLNLPSFCEGRYLVFDEHKPSHIKNSFINPLELLSEEDGKEFSHGQGIIARLAPVDYHRFHFPDTGKMLNTYEIKGLLNSVTPYALAKKPNVLVTNHRVVNIMETQNFGKIAYVEIGALTVGKIKQSYSGENFKRGDEKGYFLFGGSTVVLLTKDKVLDFNKRILEQSEMGIESFVKLGEAIGKKRTL